MVSGILSMPTPRLSKQLQDRHFRDHGYLTLGLGKIFHENQEQWNKERYWNLTGPAGLPYFKYEANMCPHGDQCGSQCIVTDEQIYDYSLRIKTMEYLRHAAQYSKQHQVPFFLMAGFRDPHLPWAAPQRMYNLYNESSIDLPPKESKTLGQNTPLIAWSKQMKPSLANGTSFPFSYNVPLSDPVMRNQRRAQSVLC